MSASDRHTLVLHSGGVDSTCAMMLEMDCDDTDVTCASMYYGQSNVYELACSRELCERAGAEYVRIDLLGVTIALRKAVALDPLGDRLDPMVVPGRSLLFIAAAATFAGSMGAGKIVLGSCDETFSRAGIPKAAFIEAAKNAVRVSSGGAVELSVPFAGYSKAEVVLTGEQLGVPWGKTFSCLRNRFSHCGCCDGCRWRQAAFREARVKDPAVFETGPIVPQSYADSGAR